MQGSGEHGSPAGPPVIVVGGGLSGLAAAVALASKGRRIVLLEQKLHPGGRAYSFPDAASGETIDNGQHVLIRGYAATMRFLGLIGSDRMLRIQPRLSLEMHHPERGFRRFSLPALPSPFHLLGGILLTDLMSMRDRLRLLRAGIALQRSAGDERRLGTMTIARWLASTGQSEETCRSFWEPLAVSIMNEHIGKASALLFVRSLKTALLSNPGAAALAIPQVGLSELYVTPSRDYLLKHGASLLCSTRAAGVQAAGNRATGVVLSDGTTLEASAVILAVPPSPLNALLPAELASRAPLAMSEALSSSPIVSIHLWFRRDFMPQEVVGLIGRTVQWAFNRRKLTADGREGGHISAVISAAHEVVGMTQEELVAIAMRDLRSAYGAGVPEPWHTVVIREKRATFSPTPEAENFRPDQKTSMPNVFIAGDWTATGYPGTIEGAVMSGFRCAELCVSLNV